MSAFQVGDAVKSRASGNRGTVTARWRDGSTYGYEVTFPVVDGRAGAFPAAFTGEELEQDLSALSALELATELERVARRVKNDSVSREESDELPTLAAEVARRLVELEQ